jgi:hypothetical protein
MTGSVEGESPNRLRHVPFSSYLFKEGTEQEQAYSAPEDADSECATRIVFRLLSALAHHKRAFFFLRADPTSLLADLFTLSRLSLTG